MAQRSSLVEGPGLLDGGMVGRRPQTRRARFSATPAPVPETSIEDPRVQNELTYYLPENWVPVIEKDVDGPHSLLLRIDAEAPNLGKLSAARRAACTVYLGSAPTTAASTTGGSSSAA